jgi:hypothetical protein
MKQSIHDDPEQLTMEIGVRKRRQKTKAKKKKKTESSMGHCIAFTDGVVAASSS